MTFIALFPDCGTTWPPCFSLLLLPLSCLELWASTNPSSPFVGLFYHSNREKNQGQDFYCEILFSSFSQQQACETLVYNFSSSENIHCWYRKKDKLTPCWFISTVERSQNWILWKNKLKPCFIQIIIQSIILLVEDVISDFIHDLYLKD